MESVTLSLNTKYFQGDFLMIESLGCRRTVGWYGFCIDAWNVIVIVLRPFHNPLIMADNSCHTLSWHTPLPPPALNLSLAPVVSRSTTVDVFTVAALIMWLFVGNILKVAHKVLHRDLHFYVDVSDFMLEVSGGMCHLPLCFCLDLCVCWQKRHDGHES